MVQAAADELESLRSRLAAAEANNRRYRWLRDSPVEVVDAVLLYREPSEWDDAIDAHLADAPVYPVSCARCGKILPCTEAMLEEGDEWECPACWDRCNEQERAGGVPT
jgi:hypothetical protein